MWWMWGHPMWGWWWIFPAMGFMFMMFMIFTCAGLFRRRGSLGGMERYDEMEELRREIRELKEQISQMKRIGG